METTEGPNVKARPIANNLPPDPGVISFASGSFVHRHDYDRLRESALSQIKQQAEVVSPPINWEKLAKERGEEIVALKMQMHDLIETRGGLERSEMKKT